MWSAAAGRRRFGCSSQTAVKEKGHQAILVSSETLRTNNIKARLPAAAEPPQALALALVQATAQQVPSQHPWAPLQHSRPPPVRALSRKHRLVWIPPA